MKIAARSHVGKVREQNEDSFYIDEKDQSVFIVADGMGGHQAGEIASNMAVETAASLLKERVSSNDHVTHELLMEWLEEILDKTNEQVYKKSFEDEKYFGMGTTLVMAVLVDQKAYIANVGDSRAYLLKENKMVQITKDHTLVQALVDEGTITQAEARVHPKRNILTRALGTNRVMQADVYTVDHMEDGTILMMCTDGLTGAVKDDEINRILNVSGVDNGCDTLIELANERGGHDNITVVAIQFTDGTTGGND